MHFKKCECTAYTNISTTTSLQNSAAAGADGMDQACCQRSSLHAYDPGSPALRAGCMCPSCNRLRCRHPETKGIASSLFGAKLTRDSCTAFLHAEQVKDSCSTAVDPSRGSRASPRKGSLSNRSLLQSSLQTASAETSRAIRARESNPGGCNCSETELCRKVECGVTGLTS